METCLAGRAADCTQGVRPLPKGAAGWSSIGHLSPSWGDGGPRKDGFPSVADYNPAFEFRMAKKTPPALPPPENYEDALAELERLVADMEGGQMPLDRLVEGYKRGAELLGYCRGRLDAVEQQVKVLEEGQLKPWIAG